MCSIITQGKFETTITDNPKSDGCYIVNFTPDPYTLQEDVSIYGRIITMGEKVSNDIYPICLWQGYKWYTETLDDKLYTVIVAMSKVVHPQL